MRLRMRHLVPTVVLAAAGLLAVATPASAAPAPHRHHHHHHWQCGGGDVRQINGANYGLLNGTQIYAPIDLGLDVSHNALGLLGSANTYDVGDRVYC